MAISIPTTLIDGGTNEGTIAAAVTVGDGGINSGTITGATEILAGGTNSATGIITGAVVLSGTNEGTIEAAVTVASGGVNSGAITGATEIQSGGTNTGAITGATTILYGGTNSATGIITGAVVLSGTNEGAVTGNLKVTGSGIVVNTATITGTVLLEAGAINAAVVTGTLYVAAGATNTGSVASGGTLIATTIVGGVTTVTTNGFTFTGVAYNLEGDALAYSYIAGVNSGLYTGSYLNLQADGLTHSYAAGVDTGPVVVKNGYYTDGYYVDNVLTPNPGEVGEDYIPHEALDNLGYYYYYSRGDGSATIASGYRVAGYYVAGVLTAAPDSAIHQAENTGNYTYSTVDGESTIADGYYTEGYYVGGTGVAPHNNTPHEALNNADHYYTYATEAFAAGTLASGYYSNGYYESGVLTSVTPSIRASAIDNSLVYYYNLLTASLTDGYYAGGYYVAGVLTIAPDNNPHEAIDEAGVYYTYSMEDGGAGSHFNGTVYNLQGDSKAYSYSSGVGSLFTGYANLQGDGLYHYYASGVDGGVKHQFTGPAIKPGLGNVTVYWDNDPLASGDTLYASQTDGSTSVSLDYYTGTDGVSGYTHVTADASGVATVTPVDHSYGSGSTWRDNSTPVEGDTIYTGRYTNATANNADFYTGTDGVSGYTHVTTNGSGLVSTFTLVDHAYSSFSFYTSGIYYGDNSTLDSGDILYTGQYTDATANSKGYYTGTDGSAGYTHITTNASGVATVTPVDHSYGSGATFWWDGNTPVNGSTIYTGRYTDATSNDSSFYINTEGSEGYTHVTTNASGVATVTPVDHSYGSGSIWYNNSTIASGDILYTGRYTNATANDAGFYTGTEGSLGYTHITTNGSGVATVTGVNHSYSVTVNSTDYYYNNSTLASGNTLYTGQYTDATANDLAYYTGTEGISGYTHVVTNASGVATVTLVDHSSTSGVGGIIYYRDSGSTTLYTGRYTNSAASATGFDINGECYEASSVPEGTGTYGALNSGNAVYDNCSNQTDEHIVGILWAQGLNLGSKVRRPDGTVYSGGFAANDGHFYNTNYSGIISQVIVCNAYN